MDSAKINEVGKILVKTCIKWTFIKFTFKFICKLSNVLFTAVQNERKIRHI